ncbi:MAG TPA: HNH endonuclease [Chromatiaceae bacterium]|nr:HNH endonuclease [Chromatiaceae bacterium]
MPHRRISNAIRQKVRQRANFLCEYCHTAEQWQYVPFTVDHVIPLSQGGEDDFSNLALACFHCNRHKSNRVTAVDPHTNKETPLFNPRKHAWRDHFMWSADRLYIIGLTPIGRATIMRLRLNRTRIIPIRAVDVKVHRHPPDKDPVQENE